MNLCGEIDRGSGRCGLVGGKLFLLGNGFGGGWKMLEGKGGGGGGGGEGVFGCGVMSFNGVYDFCFFLFFCFLVG